ncbi:homoserine kinase [Kyrpidia spormannii]|uniref:Homoserine kinase n=2 Tax=Kyrpidia spormannii TaxID=2055160 RepID=A0A2K8N4X9_9BACL|nr:MULTISPECIES: homoserine kinase [Kyrpidia]HHY66671.1 homoserine kinase [Alicyclobacillus sp.]ATY84383.1 homoserine kinase [Kyrpidia spormannii]MCL6576039.1 homoserine kinase [Kyrpidia sp.]CAB3391076.1 Homoserine kinase [Kyrpidia spormannii]CAB3391983.1 Homoserine kinase [Kyrpidia spormannii]
MAVKVRVPATTANLGPGFDSLGMALQLYNEIELEIMDQGLQFEVTGAGADMIPATSENVIYKAVQYVFDQLGRRRPGLKLRAHNAVPVTRGLGSSATAIVGGLAAANELCGRPLSADDLLELAVAMEGHPDNVAAALFGGIVVSGKTGEKTRYVKLPVPQDLVCVVVVPEVPLATKDSRKVLPTSVPFSDAVHNVNRVGLLVGALATGDLETAGAAMDDVLHEPYRMSLIPGMDAAADAGRKAGALGVALSGSGPSLIAFCRAGDEEPVGPAMTQAWAGAGLAAHSMVLRPDLRGAQVIDIDASASLQPLTR